MAKQGNFENLPEQTQASILTAGITAFSQKTYTDVTTDSITAACNISKGLLFHYFGSKRNFYLHCLSTALQRLTVETPLKTEGDFFEILFGAMDEKLNLCKCYPAETHFVNLASREACAEIAADKTALLQKHMMQIQMRSAKQLQTAILKLPLRTPSDAHVQAGLQLYIHAILNKYLLTYQETPDAFFEAAEDIKAEMKTYLQLMLNGVL